MQNPRPASSSSSAASAASTSSEALIRELSAQTAPLWRNAPGVRHSSPGPPKVAQPIRNSPGTVTPLVSFQKSLRSYPSPSGGGSTSSVNSARNVQRVSSTGATPSVPITHNYITNLDLEQTSPFFLDYLDSQAALTSGGADGAGLLNQSPAASGPNAFDHRKFMNMFQTDPRLMQGDLGSASAATITGGGNNNLSSITNQNVDSQSIQSSMDSVAAPSLVQSVQITSNNATNSRTKNLLESEDLKNNNNSGCTSNLNLNQKPLLRTQKQTGKIR